MHGYEAALASTAEPEQVRLWWPLRCRKVSVALLALEATQASPASLVVTAQPGVMARKGSSIVAVPSAVAWMAVLAETASMARLLTMASTVGMALMVAEVLEAVKVPLATLAEMAETALVSRSGCRSRCLRSRRWQR